MDAIHNTHVIHVPNGWTARYIFAVFSFHTEKLSILLGISTQQKNANALYILLNQMKTGLESRSQTSKKREQKQKVTCRCRFWAGYFNTNAH